MLRQQSSDESRVTPGCEALPTTAAASVPTSHVRHPRFEKSAPNLAASGPSTSAETVALWLSDAWPGQLGTGAPFGSASMISQAVAPCATNNNNSNTNRRTRSEFDNEAPPPLRPHTSRAASTATSSIDSDVSALPEAAVPLTSLGAVAFTGGSSRGGDRPSSDAGFDASCCSSDVGDGADGATAPDPDERSSSPLVAYMRCEV